MTNPDNYRHKEVVFQGKDGYFAKQGIEHDLIITKETEKTATDTIDHYEFAYSFDLILQAPQEIGKAVLK